MMTALKLMPGTAHHAHDAMGVMPMRWNLWRRGD